MIKTDHTRSVPALEMGERPAEAALSAWRASSVLRNAGWLLGLSMLCSLGMAVLAAAAGLPHPGLALGTGGAMALLWLTSRARNSGWGLVCALLLAGHTGYLLGPALAQAIALPHGPALVLTALAGATGIFLALCAYVLATRRSFGFLGGYVTIGIVTAFFAAMASNYYELPALKMAAATAFVMLMCAVILHQVSAVIEGTERNYVMAAAGLHACAALLLPGLVISLMLDESGHNAISSAVGMCAALYAVIMGLVALFRAGGKPG